MSDCGVASFPTQIALTCGFCGDADDVKWFCKWCIGSLCGKCKISHSTIPMFTNHIVVPRTNDVMRLYGPSKIAEQCRIHPAKEITTYCNDFQAPCCVTCHVQIHKQHNFSSIEDKYLSAENRLNDDVKKLERHIMPALDKMADKIKKDRSVHRVQTDLVRKEVNSLRKDLKQVVDESCDDTLEKLDAKEIEFNHLIDKIEVQKGKAGDLIKEIDDIIRKGDLDMIKYSPPSSDILIPDISPPKRTVPFFKPGRDIMTIITRRLGQLSWTDSDQNAETCNAPSSIITSDRSLIHVDKVMSFNSDIGVTSITTAGNKTAWVMDFDKETMYLYDGSGKMVRSITVKGSDGINDMVIKRSGDIIVTCKDRKIRSVSLNGEVSTLIDTTPFVPYGVCLSVKEEIVVCMSDQGEGNHVALYSPDTSKKLGEFRGGDGKGREQITNPYGLARNGRDFCVVNRDDNVVCVDERGDVSWVYDGKEAMLNMLFDPHGICVDRYNNLLVTDYENDCVHYLDREGRLIKVILLEEQTGLPEIWGIGVDDETGHVWVGGIGQCVVVTKYLA